MSPMEFPRRLAAAEVFTLAAYGKATTLRGA
jgi:hypothetical protein